MIYLDNAATTFPKPSSVIEKTVECITKYCANSGRSSHSLAIRTDEEIYNAREMIADFLSFPYPENVCFTTNATYALNIAIKSFITEKCHVIISDIEHNSILRPINKLSESIGVEYSHFSSDGDIEKNIEALIRKDTKAIITTLCSNVTGFEIPLSLLSAVAKRHSLKLIVDSSQLIGHKKINLSEHYCDALCAPGHKGLFGIQGVGFTIFGSIPPYKTLIEGGSGNESENPRMPFSLPERFEAGTLPAPSIVSLAAGIEFINGIGIHEIERKTDYLTNIFAEELRKNKKIRIYAASNGIVSFDVIGIDPHKTADFLSDGGIYVRSGLHCAPLVHRKLGSESHGLVRVSLSTFNTESDAYLLAKRLKALTVYKIRLAVTISISVRRIFILFFHIIQNVFDRIDNSPLVFYVSFSAAINDYIGILLIERAPFLIKIAQSLTRL